MLRAIVFVLLFWAAPLAMAKAGQGAPEGFNKVEKADRFEVTEPSGLVVGAYAAFFIGMFGYIVFVVRKQSALADELGTLAEAVEKLTDQK